MQRVDNIRKKGVISAPSTAIDCLVPAPTLVCDGILNILILEYWWVYLHVAPFSLLGHCPWYGCLEPPDLSDTDATDEKLMLKFCHFQTHDLMRAKVTGVGSPVILIVSGLDLGLAAMPDLTPDEPDKD